MMPEVRTDPSVPTINLIPRRFYQGYTPTRTFLVDFGKVACAQSICQSFSIMQICWGAIDHGHGNSTSYTFFRSEYAEFLLQDMIFRIRRLTWMICYVGVLGG